MEKKKNNKGQGRKQKYGEETVFFACRIPKSKKEQFKAFVSIQLRDWETRKV